MKPMLSLLLAALLGGEALLAAEKAPAKPGSKDKCPVCGMFVSKYPDFLGQIIFKDGSVSFFDGAKDLFKFYFSLEKYDRKHKKTEITALYVTDYYRLSPIEATRAIYVLGSNVHGPMGKELIPFEKESEAQGFMKDHLGKRLLKFLEITPAVVKELD